MKDAIGIHTICHTPDMIAAVAPGARSFDVSAAPERERREMAHMLAFWKKELHKNFYASALLSAKFSAKTGLSEAGFADFILAHPGHDVWFVNPFPHLHYLAFNMWEQGEFWHPGLCERAQRLFDAAGESISIERFPRSSPSGLLYCNYWAGTPAFWDRFMTYAGQLSELCPRVPGMFDRAAHHDDATYYPFVFERVFTAFLTMNADIKACPWPYTPGQVLAHCASEVEARVVREWAPIIDGWDAIGVYDDEQRRFFRDVRRAGAL